MKRFVFLQCERNACHCDMVIHNILSYDHLSRFELKPPLLISFLTLCSSPKGE